MTDRNAHKYDSHGRLRPQSEVTLEDGSPAERKTTDVIENAFLNPMRHIPKFDKSPTFPERRIYDTYEKSPTLPEPNTYDTWLSVSDKNPLEGKPAHSFLEEACGVMKAKAELRDTPQGERTAGKIAAVFNSLTGHNLSEADVWQILIILKMVRAQAGKFNADDYVDGAAYFGLLGECESKNPNRGK